MITYITPPPAITTEIAQSVIQTVVAEQPPIITALSAAQGPAGPQGQPGPSGAADQQITAGIALSGHRAVINSAGLAMYCDSSTISHAGRCIGVTIGAALAGALVTVRGGGLLEEPSWSWVLDAPVYVGTSGSLTQTAPIAGHITVLGWPASATSMQINIQPSVVI